MPHFGVECKKTVRVEIALGALDKAGAHILREFLGPKKYTLTTGWT